jgi:hypothetical protein
MSGGGCSACSNSVMRGGSLASERTMSYLNNPVKAYDFVPSAAVGGGNRRRNRRSHRGGGSSDFVSTLYSQGSINAPPANVMELSKNFTNTGNLTPFSELLRPTNSPLLSQTGGRHSRRRRSRRNNKSKRVSKRRQTRRK